MYPENPLHPWWYGLGSIIPNINDITFRKDEEPVINTDITYKIDCEMEVKPMRNKTYNDRINVKTIKHSIKDGMQVVLRNGEVYLVETNINGKMYLTNNQGVIGLECFDDIMAHCIDQKFDVIKIYHRPENTLIYPCLLSKGMGREILWERDEARRMTKEEIEKALGYKINIKED